MADQAWLAERFEDHRTHLRAVAYRMLGHQAEADDAVQEAWIRLSRSDAGAIDNMRGWLTTVLARVCLDMLRSRAAHPEESLGAELPEPIAGERTIDPESEAILADSVGLAMHVVLERLSPAERVAFVLHDLFGIPFEDVASIVDRSPTATRQLASRARRRVQGVADPDAEVDRERQREVVQAFRAAARGGDLKALLAVLDPDVVVRWDAAAARMADQAGHVRDAAAGLRGAAAAAETFMEGAGATRPVLVNGAAGLAWTYRGRPKVVFEFTVAGGKITAIDLIADPVRIGRMDLLFLD